MSDNQHRLPIMRPEGNVPESPRLGGDEKWGTVPAKSAIKTKAGKPATPGAGTHATTIVFGVAVEEKVTEYDVR